MSSFYTWRKRVLDLAGFVAIKIIFPNSKEMFEQVGRGFPPIFSDRKPRTRRRYKIMFGRSRRAVMTLTFKAFLAASASDRLSKLTKPTGWGDKKTEQKKETWFMAEYWVGTSVWVTQTCFFSSSLSLSGVYRTGRRSGGLWWTSWAHSSASMPK